MGERRSPDPLSPSRGPTWPALFQGIRSRDPHCQAYVRHPLHGGLGKGNCQLGSRDVLIPQHRLISTSIPVSPFPAHTRIPTLQLPCNSCSHRTTCGRHTLGNCRLYIHTLPIASLPPTGTRSPVLLNSPGPSLQSREQSGLDLSDPSLPINPSFGSPPEVATTSILCEPVGESESLATNSPAW